MTREGLAVTDAPEDRVSLGETAYRRLRADIIACRLAPGQRVTERGLAFETGLGISPIREALTRLDHDRLVKTVPRKGYQVTALTVKTVDDLFTLWRIVGPEIARLGVEQATPPQLTQLDDLFASLVDVRQRAATASGEALRRIEIASTVFDVLAGATGNDYLIGLYRRLAGDMSRVWALVYENELTATSSFVEENPWPGILRHRDGVAAADHARRYIEQSHDRVLQILSRWPSVVSSEVIPIRSAGQAGSPGA
jgi:DNA-binding GntR family transcriptional regulator